MDVFQDFIAEDYTSCGTNTYGSGIRSRLYYAPVTYFEKLVLPADGEAFLITEESLKFRQFKGWAYIDVLVDEGDLKIRHEGPTGRKKAVASVDAYLLGFRPKLVAFVDAIANIPMVFLLIDAAGQQWLIGNLRNYAWLDKADGSTGKKYDENSGYAVTLQSRSVAYPIQGDSTQLYVNKNWVWVIGDNAGNPIIFNNNTLIEL
jgi:hypothetical protein